MQNKIVRIAKLIKLPQINENIYDKVEQGIVFDQTDTFRKSSWRWLACFLACLCLIGLYFVYDYPNILSTFIKAYITHDSEKNDVRYNQLYAVYSYPNIVLPLIGGMFIDKIGLNFAIFLFGTLQLIGIGLFTFAGFIGTEEVGNDWPFIVAIAGRLFLGLGSESLAVCQSTVLARWFVGKELALASGFTTSIN